MVYIDRCGSETERHDFLRQIWNYCDVDPNFKQDLFVSQLCIFPEYATCVALLALLLHTRKAKSGVKRMVHACLSFCLDRR